ncbi:MAG: hypothetical protein JNL40_10565 [Cyclobacteriaceae bacterium]|nr:hypothetical protein [Cyclobacteriaceae bacterium]
MPPPPAEVQHASAIERIPEPPPAVTAPSPIPALSAEPGKVSTKTKTTPNLKTIFNGPPAPEPSRAPVPSTPNEPIKAAELKKAWGDYAEQRKSQAAEYQILQREYQFKSPVITVTLTNPVEESLLENFRRDLIQFLRDRLRNNDLTVSAALQDNTGKKVIYTSKEKFEHLAEKHPYLNELKDRLGLDWEF